MARPSTVLCRQTAHAQRGCRKLKLVAPTPAMTSCFRPQFHYADRSLCPAAVAGDREIFLRAEKRQQKDGRPERAPVVTQTVDRWQSNSYSHHHNEPSSFTTCINIIASCYIKPSSFIYLHLRKYRMLHLPRQTPSDTSLHRHYSSASSAPRNGIRSPFADSPSPGAPGRGGETLRSQVYDPFVRRSHD